MTCSHRCSRGSNPGHHAPEAQKRDGVWGQIAFMFVTILSLSAVAMFAGVQ